ncbi:13644_t:CDS:1, partial [Ambispora leptoticha]
AQKALKTGIKSMLVFTREGEEAYEKEFNFKNTCSFLMGKSLGGIFDGERIRIELRKELQKYEKELEEGDEKVKNLP